MPYYEMSIAGLNIEVLGHFIQFLCFSKYRIPHFKNAILKMLAEFEIDKKTNIKSAKNRRPRSLWMPHTAFKKGLIPHAEFKKGPKPQTKNENLLKPLTAILHTPHPTTTTTTTTINTTISLTYAIPTHFPIFS